METIEFKSNSELDNWLNQFEGYEVISNSDRKCVLYVFGYGTIKALIENIFE